MDDALATSTQLAAFRTQFKTYGDAPSVWMSATVNTDWLRTVEEGPALFRFDEKVSWLRGAHNLSYGHAKAIVHEHDLRRAARKF